MKPWLLCAVALFVSLCPGAAPAQETAVPDTPPQGGEFKPPVKKLMLTPAAVPMPALRYRLLPALRDLHTGNAALHYYRTFALEWYSEYRRKEVQKAFDRWDTSKPGTPPEELRFVLRWGAYDEIRLGARSSYCDWEMLPRLRKEGVAMLLPELQGFREQMLLLAARARFQTMEKKYDDALDTLQTAFAFSRHVGDGPALVQSLVGIAMANITAEAVDQLIRQEGSPNLYWALTDLPQPFVNLRQSLQGEKILFDTLLPGIRQTVYDVNAQPLTQAEVQAVLAKLFRAHTELGIRSAPADRTGQQLAIALMAARAYPEARQFLIDQGHKPEVVDRMPVVQVALMYEVYNYDRYYDEMAKWYGFPYPEMKKGIDRARNEFHDRLRSSSRIGTVLAGLLLPATEKAFEASYRLERKIAYLRCLEAIRAHAAKEGRLPGSLKEIQVVPVPNDPYTGQPFDYRRDGNAAILTAPPPAGVSAETAYAAQFAWSYELRLKQ